jgi:hypothetical protein
MKRKKRTRVRRARSRRKTKAALRRSRKRTRVRRTRSRRKTGGMMPVLKGRRPNRGHLSMVQIQNKFKSEQILRKMENERLNLLNNKKKNVGVDPAHHRELPTNLESMKNFLAKKIGTRAPVEKEPEVDPSWLTAGKDAEADWAAAKQEKYDYNYRMQQNKQRNLVAAVAEWKTITQDEQEEINELLKQASHPTELYNFKMFEQFMGKNSPLANKIKMTHGDAGNYRRGPHLRKIFNSIDADSTNTLSVDNFRNFFHSQSGDKKPLLPYLPVAEVAAEDLAQLAKEEKDKEDSAQRERLGANVVIEGGGRKLSRKRTRVRRTRSRRKVSGGKRRGRKRTLSRRRVKGGRKRTLSRKRTRNTISRRNKKGGMLTSTGRVSPGASSSADTKDDRGRQRRNRVVAEIVRRSREGPAPSWAAVDDAHREFAEENLAKVMVAWRDAEAAAAAAAVPLRKIEKRLRYNKNKWDAHVPSWGPYTVSEDDQIALRILKEAWGDAQLQANKIKNKKDFTEQLLAERIKKEDAQTAAQQAQTAAQHEFGRLKGIIDPASAAVTVVSRVDLPHTDERSLSPTRWE